MSPTVKPRGTATSELLAAPYLFALAAELVIVGILTQSSRGNALLWAEELGWLGLGSMVVMQLYSVRRRVRALRRIGSLRAWLDWHIFMGVQGGICITYHSSRIDNWQSAPGVSLVLMWIVLLSGLFGRYLFSLVPRTVNGDALTARELDTELRELGTTIATAPWVEIPSLPRDGGLRASLASARSLRMQLAALHTSVDDPRLHALIRRRSRLAVRQTTMLAAERALAWWLVVHRPLVFLLGTSAMLHVIAHFAFRPQS